MEIRLNQLKSHLERNDLAPVYIIAGDEPLQKQEAGDLLRATARSLGFEERHTFVIDSGKADWSPILAATQSMSLFSQKQLIEVKQLVQSPGNQGRDVLRAIVDHPSPDNLFVLSLPRLDSNIKKSAWFKAMLAAGVLINVWPVTLKDLPGWINQRMQASGLNADLDACKLLAERSEGNLLAAMQEIEKLALSGHSHITEESVLESVLDSSRFDIFSLADSLLTNDTQRYHQILTSLEATGTPAMLVRWVLAREIRTVIGVASGKIKHLPGNRQSLVNRALKHKSIQQWQNDMSRLCKIDALIKGQGFGSPWAAMLDLGLNSIFSEQVS